MNLSRQPFLLVQRHHTRSGVPGQRSPKLLMHAITPARPGRLTLWARALEFCHG